MHIGVIPDGNRRYCKKNKLQLKEYTSLIIKNLFKFTREVINGLDERYVNILNEISEVSCYLASNKNLERAEASTFVPNLIKRIYSIYVDRKKYFTAKELKILSTKLSILRIQFIGSPFNSEIDLILAECERLTSQGDKLISFAFNYDYKEKYECGDQTNIDLIVRPGYEKRLSGFFPLKSAYAELFFIDMLFPELTVQTIETILKEYKKRNRRFGS